MKKLPLFLLFIIAAAFTATAQDRCFKNDGLKNGHTVSFTISGNKVAGTFVVSTYDGSEPDKTFEFTGAKSGSQLTIKFKGKAPYELRPGSTKIVWTLGSESLKIPIYGKNYETGKYSTYVAVYEACTDV